MEIRIRIAWKERRKIICLTAYFGEILLTGW